MRTESSARASQTRVQFLLRPDEAINPRCAPQDQHGSGSYFSFSLASSPRRHQLRTSPRQLLPKKLHLPQAPVTRNTPFSATSSPVLSVPWQSHVSMSSRCSCLSWSLARISYASCMTHACLASAGKWSARPWGPDPVCDAVGRDAEHERLFQRREVKGVWLNVR